MILSANHKLLQAENAWQQFFVKKSLVILKLL